MKTKASYDFEERVYERSSLLPYKGCGGHFRFAGRFDSGYPKNLETYNYITGWSECKNINIATRIQHEKELFPECTAGNHDWSRNTVSSINCKRCGIVVIDAIMKQHLNEGGTPT